MICLIAIRIVGAAQEIKVGRLSGNTPFTLLIPKNNKKPLLL